MTESEFADMFIEHYAAVLGYGLRRVDAATAHDVAAETFLVAWRQLQTSPELARPWLLTVARRVLSNELRRQDRQGRLVDRVGQHGAAADPDHADSGISEVTVAMATLSEADQELLQLIGWEQLDLRETATVLGCSVAAVKVRLHRARRRLPAALQKLADAETRGDGATPHGRAAAVPSPLPIPTMENLR